MKASLQKEKTASTATRERGRVLVISDEPPVLLLEPITSAEFEVVSVCTGSAAAVSLRKTRPQVVIANTALNGISTGELVRMLNQTQDGVPLILVGTAPSTFGRRWTALSEGAVDYFQIPVEVELLLLRVAQMVATRQTMDKLRSEADLDHLTGLANRRRFRGALTHEVERWRRYGVPCALLLLDIDHMKAINDRFGHPSGDLVIRHVANTLTEVSRDNDTPARLGGEEFALLLANISAERAAAAAERLRVVLSERPVADIGGITVSIGVAACPAHANSERTLYAASDRALYVAKNEGRDRIAVAPLMQEKLPGV
ncbi:MAG TPA: diguanylate cyclase [Pyrinomonadaceae bacterium]|nr:diguanylate cyclase [Pyrinomonadaceae bacterium]